MRYFYEERRWTRRILSLGSEFVDLTIYYPANWPLTAEERIRIHRTNLRPGVEIVESVPKEIVKEMLVHLEVDQVMRMLNHNYVQELGISFLWEAGKLHKEGGGIPYSWLYERKFEK